MNRGKMAWLKFKELASSKGYQEKVVGDYSYSKTRSPQSPRIRLLGARGNKLQVSENGVRYEVEIERRIG